MIQKLITFWVSPHIYFIVLSFIDTSHEAACLGLVNYSSNENLYHNSYREYDEQNTSFIPIVEDNDPNYPYEQILQLVKDTKRILSSHNATEKMLLNNLDPRIYDDYLSGDISDNNIAIEISTDSISSKPAASGAEYSPSIPPPDTLCLEDVQYEFPRRLTGIDDKEYFIINVGNDLRQKYNSVICKNPNKKCGFIYAVEGYSYSCEQSFDGIRNFVSIPVGNRISVDQQRLQLFKVPDGCFCKGSRYLE